MLDPYEITLSPDGDYIFTTEYNIRYSILFRIIDNFSESEQEIGSINEIILTNVSDKKHKDIRVEATISFFMINYFFKWSSPIFFTCDSSDEREEVRFRLFRKWFNKYKNKYFLALEMHTQSFSYNGNINIHVALIIRENYENKQAYIDSFYKHRCII